MAKNGFKILDSDMHIMEPPDLWERYIDKNYQDRAPRGITSTNVRDLRMAHPDGREWGNQTTEGNRVDRGHNFQRNQNIYGSYAERGWSSELRVNSEIAQTFGRRGYGAAGQRPARRGCDRDDGCG